MFVQGISWAICSSKKKYLWTQHINLLACWFIHIWHWQTRKAELPLPIHIPMFIQLLHIKSAYMGCSNHCKYVKSTKHCGRCISKQKVAMNILFCTTRKKTAQLCVTKNHHLGIAVFYAQAKLLRNLTQVWVQYKK